MMFDPKLQETFDRMFSVGKTNEERLSDYYAEKERLDRPWILIYELNGVELPTSGRTPDDCIKRTNEKHGKNNWAYVECVPKKEFFKRVGA